jgi:hypothetical protein
MTARHFVEVSPDLRRRLEAIGRRPVHSPFA